MRTSVIFAILAALFISLAAAQATPRDNQGEGAERLRSERQADLYFLEAVGQKQKGNTDAYVDLLSRAYRLNPSDPYLAFEYGRFRFASLDQTDSAAVQDAYRLVRNYIIDGEGAKDYYLVANTFQLANLTGNADDARLMLQRIYTEYPDRPAAAMAYAHLLSETNNEEDIKEALAVYDTVESREGLSATITLNRVRIFLSQGDTAAVIDNIRSAAQKVPSSVPIALLAAEVFDKINLPDSAMAYYDRAVEIDPSSGMAYYNRANALIERGDTAGYDRDIDSALTISDLDLDLKGELMQEYVMRVYKDPSLKDHIIELFNELIKNSPYEPRLRTLYATYLTTTEDYEGAAEQVSYQLDIDPTNPGEWQFLTSLYLALKEDDKAIKTVERASELFPYDANVMIYHSAALSSIGRNDEAIDFIQTAVKERGDSLSPYDQSNLLTQLGDLLYKSNMLDSAITYYDRAIELNPNNDLALNNYAYYLACSDRDLDRALSLVERSMEEKPDSPTNIDTYAWVLFKMGKYDKAREAIDRAIDLTEKAGEEVSAELLEHAGDIYFMIREPEKALDLWKQALELDPDNELLSRKVKAKTYFYE